MRKYLLFILLNALAYTYASAQSFCHLVQDVGTYYEDTVETSGTYYYSAWTYDLPMDVYITSLDPTCSEPPQVWADLTCTPGIYDDPNVQELVQDTAKYGVSVPMALGCTTEMVDGHYKHHLKLGKSYRNKLKLIGVDYNVRAYVKVILPCAGVALMEQDTSSMACLNDARWLRLVDSTRVLAHDTLTTYILPFKEWLTEADSMALYWEGTDSVRVWVAGDDCEFAASAQDAHVWNYYDIPANSEYHISKTELINAIERGTQDTAGFFYSRVVGPTEGRLFTHPLTADTKGSTLLQLDTMQAITANGTATYSFPTDWQAVEWIADTRKVVKLYLHASPEEAAVDSFKFDFQDSIRRVLVWTKPEMNAIRGKASGPLLYVRFASSKDFTLTPHPYTETGCWASTIRLRSGVPISSAGVKSKEWRLYYPDFEGYPMDIDWYPTSNINQNIYIADTCDYTARSNIYYLMTYYKQTPKGTSTVHVDSATIEGWKTKGLCGGVKSDGWLYVKFTTENNASYITFTSYKPEEEDPEDLPEEPILTGIETMRSDIECTKQLYNGQIIIRRAGKAYTITGQPVKID